MEYFSKKTENEIIGERGNLNFLKDHIVLIKYGGNAMLDEDLKTAVITDICYLKSIGCFPVLVHGGGPFIQKTLEQVGIQSEFIGGHRKTTPEAMTYVEMVLKGQVNGEIVKKIQSASQSAVGMSGKDGQTVTSQKRYYQEPTTNQSIDLGNVGNVQQINTKLIHVLLQNGYIPVIASLAISEEGEDHNINADMFAGHLAGALEAKTYVSLTNVNGIMYEGNPDSIIRKLQLKDMNTLDQKHIKGGMIPKLESCKIALEKGAETARIINGTIPHAILQDLSLTGGIGTYITH